MYSKHTLLGSIIRHLVLWIFVAFALFPVLWIFSASINPTNNMNVQRLIPKTITWNHYVELFTNPQHPFGIWLWNSIKIAVITSVLTVILSALAAYAFSRFRFKGRRTGLLGLLLIQMFPQMLALVAIYMLLLQFGKISPWIGLNTHTGLIMVYLGGAMGFNTWLMKGYFDTIPRSLEESAKVDGASQFQAFTRIILPLAKPILATIFVLTFIGIYSEYILARVLLSTTHQYTLAVGLNLFISGTGWGTRWGIFAAGALIGAIPFLIIFAIAQHLLVSGLTRGSVKG
jgi:ABC-type maltose transport system permease subunit